jgi:hypothetical protein
VKLAGRLHPTSTKLTKLNAIDREHNSPLLGGGREKRESDLPVWEWGRTLSLNPRIMGGQNAELPYFVGGGTDMPE